MVRQTGPAAKNRTHTGYRQQSLQREFSKGKSCPQESQIHIHIDGPHTEHCHPGWAHRAEPIWISHLKKPGSSSTEPFFPQNILATDLASPLAIPYSDGLIQLIHWAEKHPSQSDGFCQVGNSTSSRKGQSSRSTSTKEREDLCSCAERDCSQLWQAGRSAQSSCAIPLAETSSCGPSEQISENNNAKLVHLSLIWERIRYPFANEVSFSHL